MSTVALSHFNRAQALLYTILYSLTFLLSILLFDFALECQDIGSHIIMAFSVFDHSIVQQGQLIMTVMTPDRRLGDNSVLNEQHERVRNLWRPPSGRRLQLQCSLCDSVKTILKSEKSVLMTSWETV